MPWTVGVAAELAQATSTRLPPGRDGSLSRSHQLQCHSLWPASRGLALPFLAQVVFLKLEATSVPPYLQDKVQAPSNSLASLSLFLLP